jgi:HD-like signal output (HDOD) protein
VGSKSSRDEHLDRAVRAILQTEGVPPFHENANELIARTLDLEASTAEVARSVLKDLGLASQILRIANSALYNRSGKPILSISHAISLMGWENLRNLVTGVRYLEHYAKSSAGLRELMFLSLLTANHGRELASAVGFPRPEEAYVCGLFRSLGEVLTACHSPQQYSSVVLQMYQEKLAERAASLRVLNYSFDDLGSRVAAAWNLPAKVRLCLAGPSFRAASGLDQCLISVANCGHQLTRLIYREGSALDSVCLESLVDQAGRRARLTPEDLEEIVESAGAEAGRTMSAFRIPMTWLLLEHQAESAQCIVSQVPFFDGAALHDLEVAVHTASRVLIDGEFDLNELIHSLLDRTHSAGFDHVVVALLDESRRCLRGRIGSGKSASEFVSRFCLPVTPGSQAPWQRTADLLVGAMESTGMEWEQEIAALGPGAFCLLPIVIDGAVAGCLYADRSAPAPNIETARWALTRTRDVIGRAMRRKASRR